MKIKNLFIGLLLVIGVFQMNAQIGSETGKDPCASFAQVVQNCNDNGTVDLTFLLSNNMQCNASGVTILGPGFGQSFPSNIFGQTVGNVSYSYTGATPGELLCFEVKLHKQKGLCCSTEVCIMIDDCNPPGPCELEAVLEQTGGCGPDDRWVSIALSGGTPPYSGPQFSTNDDFGNFEIDGLSPGYHTFTFKDVDGCEINFSVNIPAGDCSQFHNLYQNENTDPIPLITSEVSATIFVSMAGYCIPDLLEVFIDGDLVVDFIAGEGGCGNTEYQFGDGMEFCVEPCQEVEIRVTPNFCPGQFDCDDATNTVYDVFTTCTLKDGGGNGGGGDGDGSKSPKERFDDLRNNNREFLVNQKAIMLNKQQSVNVYPNPVSNALNISISDVVVEYQTVSIMNSEGQEVYTKNMSNLDQIRIETNAFSKGIYFIEFTDINGNKMVQKFMKLDESNSF